MKSWRFLCEAYSRFFGNLFGVHLLEVDNAILCVELTGVDLYVVKDFNSRGGEERNIAQSVGC